MPMKPLASLFGLFLMLSLQTIAPALEFEGKEIPQALFEKVFGSLAQYDPAFHAMVKDSTPGARHYVDSNQDGHPEEVWFLDTAKRHPDKFKPLLVRAVDEDGDLGMGCEPDTDSDLYIADWKADGKVDSIIDYTDTDRDGDVDEMGIYFYGPWEGYFKEPPLRVWWGRDEGDDNRLWFDVGYTYEQSLCEYRSHFGGDETFVCFALPLHGDHWIPYWENPFLFYDHDDDGATEEVIRYCGIERDIENIRHSFDADNDSSEDNPRDYDVSISGWMPGSRLVDGSLGAGHSNIRFDDLHAEGMTLRGFPTSSFVSHAMGIDLVDSLSLIRTQLVWDEIDHNVDQQTRSSAYERWEGIICPKTDYFPQIGGPHCGILNVRIEADMQDSAPYKVYCHPTDGRIHLLGADHAWMDVDRDFDDKADFHYEMKDANGDGILDSWSLDLNMDGAPEDAWQAAGDLQAEVFPYKWAGIHSRAARSLGEPLEELHELEGLLAESLKAHQATLLNGLQSGVMTLFPILDPASQEKPELRRKLVSSRESLRFMLTVSVDLQLAALKNAIKDDAVKSKLAEARARGDMRGMIAVLRDDLQAKCNSQTFAEWMESLQDRSRKLAAWNDTWFPPNVGWESEKTAYRCYWGQFDFFGKTVDGLIYPTILGESYHEEQPWGMDALHAGDSAGCGGLVLYVNGAAYPVRTPYGKGDIVFTHRLLKETNTEVQIEMIASNVGPKEHPHQVKLILSSHAGHPETSIQATVEGGLPEDVIQLGIELVKLRQEETFADSSRGILAAWGIQSPDIGWIGMSILFPSRQASAIRTDNQSNQAIFDLRQGEALEYAIYCEWLNGARFNFCPSAADWFEKASACALALEAGKASSLKGNAP